MGLGVGSEGFYRAGGDWGGSLRLGGGMGGSMGLGLGSGECLWGWGVVRFHLGRFMGFGGGSMGRCGGLYVGGLGGHRGVWGGLEGGNLGTEGTFGDRRYRGGGARSQLCHVTFSRIT